MRFPWRRPRTTSFHDSKGIRLRFLHTGDWHVGRTIRGHSRIDEFAGALDEVVEVAASEAVDVVLISGDIHDQRAVTPEADRLIFETLIDLSERGIRVVAIPGNHDSAARLSAFGPLLQRIGTTVVPHVVRPDDGGIVEVISRDGAQRALVACIPFVSPRRFSDALGLFEDTAEGYVHFDEKMGALLEAHERAFRPEAVNIVLGHMFVSGAQPSGSEREVTIGADYAVSPARIPATASYVALGHIHKGQKVTSAPAETRYCGSLVQLDFGEKGQDKSVLVIDARPGKPPKAKAVPIVSGRRLEDVTGTIEDLPTLAASTKDAYLRVNLLVTEPTPGIADRVREILPTALDVRLVLPQQTQPDEGGGLLSGLGPREQFLSYFKATHEAPAPRELLAAFDRVYEEVTTS
jgi:DNA repair protein SbcD/Mre11